MVFGGGSPGQPFRVEPDPRGRPRRFRLIGELDLSTAPILEETLAPVCAEGGGDVTLDLADLAFLDSAGLHALVRLLGLVQATGGQLVIANPSPQARRLFDVTGLERSNGLVIRKD